MKRLLFLTIVAAGICQLLYSCDSPTVTGKPAAIGAPYELLVLCSGDKWDSPLGDTVRSVLQCPVEGINGHEPHYNVLRITPGQFSGMMQRNRNVLNIAVSPDAKAAALNARYDTYATPQIIVTLSAPDDSTATAYVSEHAQELVAIFEIAERNRDLEANRKFGDNKLTEQIKETFGFEMPLSKGYKIRNTIPDKHFMWLSYEYPTASQGILIYSYPYSGLDDFSQGMLLARRNEFTALVPGENPGSYMTTADVYLPELTPMRINGRAWAELRGFWDVKGDFMGGPFVSYSTLDGERQRVVTVDFYLYSPNKDKRNFLRSLEHVIFGVDFGDAERPDGNEKDNTEVTDN